MMKKKLVMAIVACMVLACGCSNRQEKKPGSDVQDTQDVQAVTPAAVDLGGDKSVPKTETENLGSMEKFESLEEMSKAAGTGFLFPEPDGYKNKEYFMDDGEQVVVFSNEDGSTISFRKKPACGIAMDSSYTTIYTMKDRDREIMIGSRGNEDKAGVAVWEDGGFQYKIETTQWQEVGRDFMMALVSNTQ